MPSIRRRLRWTLTQKVGEGELSRLTKNRLGQKANDMEFTDVTNAIQMM